MPYVDATFTTVRVEVSFPSSVPYEVGVNTIPTSFKPPLLDPHIPLLRRITCKDLYFVLLLDVYSFGRFQ